MWTARVDDWAKYPHLARHGKHGTLRFRRAVPFKLRPIIGRTEIVVSLKTAEQARVMALHRHVSATPRRRRDYANIGVRYTQVVARSFTACTA